MSKCKLDRLVFPSLNVISMSQIIKKSKEMCSYMCSQFNVIEPISAWEHSLLSSICVDYMADESKWIEVLDQSDSPRTNDHMTFRFKRQQWRSISIVDVQSVTERSQMKSQKRNAIQKVWGHIVFSTDQTRGLPRIGLKTYKKIVIGTCEHPRFTV